MKSINFESILRKQFPHVPTEGQARLISLLADYVCTDIDNKVFLLKGYAGTGKTSIISALVKALPEIRSKAVLLAPTGRAAKVLASYSGKTATTIHRRIYFQSRSRDGAMLLRLQDNLYVNAVFLVDEASMISGETIGQSYLYKSRNLLDDLMEYVHSGRNCKLVLIGDTAQLPPVGTSMSPALDPDFMKTRYNISITSFELNQVMRQSLESGILANATGIRNKINDGDYSPPFFSISEKMDVEKLDGTFLEERLNDSYHGHDREQSIIVTRSNKRANLFNQEIRRRILFRENEIETGDYIMVVKNNYFWLDPQSRAGFIANGDIAEIMSIQGTEDIYGFRFADASIRMLDYPDMEVVDVKLILDTIMAESASLSQEQQNDLFNRVMEDYSDIPERSHRLQKVKTNPHFNALQIKFAYAMTCHKTQGGQWENVFIDQGYIVDDMIDKEYLRWLYTALTRATKTVHLVNFKEQFYE